MPLKSAEEPAAREKPSQRPAKLRRQLQEAYFRSVVWLSAGMGALVLGYVLARTHVFEVEFLNSTYAIFFMVFGFALALRGFLILTNDFLRELLRSQDGAGRAGVSFGIIEASYQQESLPEPGTIKIAEKRQREASASEFGEARRTRQDIETHFALNIAQAKISFAVAVIAMVVGLLTILATVAFVMWRGPADGYVPIVSGVLGLLSSFTGATFLYVYRRANDEKRFYFDKLLRIDETLQAMEIASRLADPLKRDAMMELIALDILRRHSGTTQPRISNELSNELVPDSVRTPKP